MQHLNSADYPRGSRDPTIMPLSWFEGEYYREVLARHNLRCLRAWRNRTADFSLVEYLRLAGPSKKMPRPPPEELEEWYRRTARDLLLGLEYAVDYSDNEDEAEEPDDAEGPHAPRAEGHEDP